MSKEAMHIALDALERLITYDNHGDPYDGKDVEAAEAIEALRTALAQPKEWVGLTDEDKQAIFDACYDDELDFFSKDSALSMAEAKLKEKNT